MQCGSAVQPTSTLMCFIFTCLPGHAATNKATTWHEGHIGLYPRRVQQEESLCWCDHDALREKKGLHHPSFWPGSLQHHH
mmetsp:Transcript_22286/g.45834  ORF Transcript_22286/g.45834 Transcript_22286/m.45834 type:complete len:80 (+) Transcript_22286:197-436(+)